MFFYFICDVIYRQTQRLIYHFTCRRHGELRLFRRWQQDEGRGTPVHHPMIGGHLNRAACRAGGSRKGHTRCVTEEDLTRLLTEPGHQPVVGSGGTDPTSCPFGVTSGWTLFGPRDGRGWVTLTNLSQTNDEARECEKDVLFKSSLFWSTN